MSDAEVVVSLAICRCGKKWLTTDTWAHCPVCGDLAGIVKRVIGDGSLIIWSEENEENNCR